METFRYSDGAWKIFVSAVLEDASLQLENLFECEMLFPRTKFRLSRSTIYSPSKLNISNSLREVKYTFSLSRTTISLGQVEYLFKIIHQCNWRLHLDNDDLSETHCVTSTDINELSAVILYIWFSLISSSSVIIIIVASTVEVASLSHCPTTTIDWTWTSSPVNVLL